MGVVERRDLKNIISLENFCESILKDVAKGKIKQLNEREINDIFNPATYIGDAESIVEEAVSD